MDNEEDCGHVIRVGDPGRHCNNDNVRDDLHQDSENAGGDHMADTASLKEILFRNSTDQRRDRADCIKMSAHKSPARLEHSVNQPITL